VSWRALGCATMAADHATTASRSFKWMMVLGVGAIAVVATVIIMTMASTTGVQTARARTMRNRPAEPQLPHPDPALTHTPATGAPSQPRAGLEPAPPTAEPPAGAPAASDVVAPVVAPTGGSTGAAGSRTPREIVVDRGGDPAATPAQRHAAPQSPATVVKDSTEEDIEFPSIYVYSHPPGVKYKRVKSHRPYWKLETALLAGLKRRGRLVNDPGKAQFFWIPHSLLGHRYTSKDLESYWNGTLRPLLHHIYYDLPHFNASQGRNHVFVSLMDGGDICDGHAMVSEDPLFKAVVHPSIIVGYHGTDSLPAPPARASSSRAVCFDKAHDIQLPQGDDKGWNSPSSKVRRMATKCHMRAHPAKGDCSGWLQFLEKRARGARPFYFRGKKIVGRCSVGIRPWIKGYCKRGRPKRRCCYGGTCKMGSGVFGLAPAGWGCWSSRYYDAVDKDVIPVRLADPMVSPFARYLNYSEFEVRVMTGDPTTLPNSGGPKFKWMLEQARSWLKTCRRASRDPTAKQRKCLQHPVSVMMHNLARAGHWFGWNVKAKQGAFTLFEKELVERWRGRHAGYVAPDDGYPHGIAELHVPLE